jgi:hypothetical protein
MERMNEMSGWRRSFPATTEMPVTPPPPPQVEVDDADDGALNPPER